MGPGREPPVVLVKWYDFTRWILEKVDSFPKNQRFVFGTRLALMARLWTQTMMSLIPTF